MSCFKGTDSLAGGIVQQGEIIRRLGHGEKYQLAAEKSDLYHGCMVSCRYHLPSLQDSPNTGIDDIKETVEKAIASTIIEHPLLQPAIGGLKTKKPCWIRLNEIDFHNHVEWRLVPENEEWDTTFHDVCGSFFRSTFPDRETLPGWRITVLHGKGWLEVMFAYEHSIFDGMSGRIFHASMSRYLNGESNGQDIMLKDRVLTLPPTTNFPPSQDALLKFGISPGFFLDTVLNEELRPSWLPKRTSATNANWAPFQAPPFETRTALITIDAERANRVLKECRGHNTTLTGLIHALALLSFASRVPADNAEGFKSNSPVSLRRFVKPGCVRGKKGQYDWVVPERTMENLVSYDVHEFDPGVVKKVREISQAADNGDDKARSEKLEPFIWETAVYVRKRLQAFLDKGLQDQVLGMMKFVDDWTDFLELELKKTRVGTWEVSNLGAMEDEIALDELKLENAKWKKDRVVFTQSAAVIATALQFGVAGIQRKAVTISASWQAGIIADEMAHECLGDLERTLNFLGQNGTLFSVL